MCKGRVDRRKRLDFYLEIEQRRRCFMTDESTKVLIVEDEQSFADALRSGLEQEGFTVHFAADGESALMNFDAAEPDVVLLDVMLPKMSGIDVCREIRQR